MDRDTIQLAIVGGGAAGVFSAISAIEANPRLKVVLLERAQMLLSKVKISGGGRCNVTHSCFDPRELIKNYPRGSKELLGPFTKYQPKDVVQWFENKGVRLKRESDGRMFPTTDSSQTIIDCLIKAADGVQIEKGKEVQSITKEDPYFLIQLKSGERLQASSILLATGSQTGGFELAKTLGHTIVEPVPSLFTFNVPDSPLNSLSGIAVENAKASLPEFKREFTGPLLITHFGFSGPAILKLSAFAAREFYACDYYTPLIIDWIPGIKDKRVFEVILSRKNDCPGKAVSQDSLFHLPKKLWKTFIEISGIDAGLTWSRLTKVQGNELILKLKKSCFQISGKTTYKQEFVTCGGIRLSEVNFQTMESKHLPGLYFAGEILDLDGITGGFNFQAAWTTGWLAGNAIARKEN